MGGKLIKQTKIICKALVELFQLHRSMRINYKNSLNRLDGATLEESIRLLQIHEENAIGRREIFNDYKRMVKDAGYKKYGSGPLTMICVTWLYYVQNRYDKKEKVLYKKVVDSVVDEIEIHIE